MNSQARVTVEKLARALGVPYVLHLHGADYRLFWTDERPWLSARIKAMFEGAAAAVNRIGGGGYFLLQVMEAGFEFFDGHDELSLARVWAGAETEARR